MLKIWGRANSINVQKVMWTVAELGLAHERIEAGMAFGVVGEPHYAAMNPNQLIPVLQDGDLTLWESNAIVRYLARRYGAGTLCPDDDAAAARADMWMDWQQTRINPALSPVFLGLVRTPPEKRDAAAIEAARDATAKGLAILDRALAGHKFLLGDTLTMADIPLGCVAYRWYQLPIERPELPNLKAWYDRLAARPAFARHVMLPVT
jgi:glutathione S-transferase